MTARKLNLFQREPVIVLLNGLATVVSLILIALKVNGAIDLTGEGITAIVAAVQGTAALLSLTLRSVVIPTAKSPQGE